MDIRIINVYYDINVYLLYNMNYFGCVKKFINEFTVE